MICVQKYLPPSYHNNIQLQKFAIGVVDKKNANQIILALRKMQTKIQHLIHLKKIKKIQCQLNQQQKNINKEMQNVKVLLCLEKDKEVMQNIMQELGKIILKVQYQLAPVNSPTTKQQYKQWSQFWPINFIELQVYKQMKHSQAQINLLNKLIENKQDFIIFNKKEYLFGQKYEGSCQKGTIIHPIMKLIDKWPTSQVFKENNSLYYYLTELRLIVKSPICGMCAMALVHSRLDRIYFFSVEDIQYVSEILFSQKLNHRIKIFQISRVK